MSPHKTVAYQGEEGAFSYLCAKKVFDAGAVFIGTKTFSDAFALLQKGQVDYAILPIENSIVGSIYEVYDELSLQNLSIIGESYYRVHHCLLVAGPTEIQNIKKVISHPKALGQCTKYLSRFPWIEKVEFYDTAGSAKYLASQAKALDTACIASCEAGEIYGLTSLAENIEDTSHNYTRFLAIAKEEKKETGNKATILFTLEHKVGALAKVLYLLQKEGINITKLESRPIIDKPFAYRFTIDCEKKEHLPLALSHCMEEMKPWTTSLQLLGLYEADTWIL